MSNEYERVELRSMPHLRPLVVLGVNDRAIIKELNSLEYFTECTRTRDLDKVCTPVSHRIVGMARVIVLGVA